MLITETDLSNLKQILVSAKGFLTKSNGYIKLVEDRLNRARVVADEEIPSDVITINTQVRIHDLDRGPHLTYTLVFPQDADVAKNRISVLAPIGFSLLGYRAGDLIECSVGDIAKRLRVKEIVYQPEAARRVA